MNAALQQATCAVTESAKTHLEISYATATKVLEPWLQCKYAWVKSTFTTPIAT